MHYQGVLLMVLSKSSLISIFPDVIFFSMPPWAPSSQPSCPPFFLCILSRPLYADFFWQSAVMTQPPLDLRGGRGAACFCMWRERAYRLRRAWVICVCAALQMSVSCHIHHRVAVSALLAPPPQPSLQPPSFGRTVAAFWWNLLFFSRGALTLTLYFIFATSVASGSIQNQGSWCGVQCLESHNLF